MGKMAKRYSAVVFDVGGTLLRLNLDLMVKAYVDAAAARGVRLDFERARATIAQLELELPQRQQQRLISLEEHYGASFWDEFYLEGFRRLGLRGDMSAAAGNIRERFQRAEFEALFPDTIPTLDALAARDLILGVLSNYSPNCEDVLHQVGVHSYFTFFVVSALAGFEKPDPRIFELVVRAADRPRSEIVYVGDSLYHDVAGARGAGIDPILVDREDRFPSYEGVKVRNLNELVSYIEPIER